MWKPNSQKVCISARDKQETTTTKNTIPLHTIKIGVKGNEQSSVMEIKVSFDYRRVSLRKCLDPGEWKETWQLFWKSTLMGKHWPLQKQLYFFPFRLSSLPLFSVAFSSWSLLIQHHIKIGSRGRRCGTSFRNICISTEAKTPIITMERNSALLWMCLASCIQYILGTWRVSWSPFLGYQEIYANEATIEGHSC